MRIGLLTSSLFSHGGVQRVTSNVMNGLLGNHQVEIIYFGNLPYSEANLYGLNKSILIVRKQLSRTWREKILRTFINKINGNTGFFNNKYLANILRKSLYPKSQSEDLTAFLNSKNYDVIIALEGEMSLLLASIAANLNAKTLGWQHSTYEAYFHTRKEYSWMKESLAKSLFPNLDNLIVLTKHDQFIYKDRMGIETLKISNPLSFVAINKSKCCNKNILSVGRLVKAKGFDLLVKAFKEFSSFNLDWTLTIVGEGPEKENLLRQIKELSLCKRIFIEDFSNNIKDFYLESSIFVSPSRWEGFGLVILEAMECGLPVLAFANEGPKEIITHNVDGVLIQKGNVAALAHELSNLVNDGCKRTELSINAVRKAREFNIDKIIFQWEQLLN